VCAASRRLGLRFAWVSRYAPSHASFRHIWAARNPTGFFIVPPKHRKQPKRYAPLLEIFSKNISEDIDINKKKK
jgi:hypothetical protein